MANPIVHPPHWTTSGEMLFSAQSKYALELPELFPLAINFYKFTAAHPVVPNYHDFYEIGYFCAGQAFYRIADHKFKIQQGSLVFIPAGQMHTIDSSLSAPILSISIYFMPELLYHPGSNPLENNFLLPFNTHSTKPPVLQEEQLGVSVWQIMMEMYKELDCAHDFYQLALKNKLCDLLLLVLRTMKQVEMIQTTPPQNKIKRLQEVFEFIHKNYTNPIPLEILAELACMSAEYFCRYFKQVTGVSPMNYILRYRIDQAKDLLVNSSMSITEISFQVGFNSSSYFNRMFQRFTRMNPKKFRQTYSTTFHDKAL